MKIESLGHMPKTDLVLIGICMCYLTTCEQEERGRAFLIAWAKNLTDLRTCTCFNTPKSGPSRLREVLHQPDAEGARAIAF